jgi:hypothetical protein
MTEKREISSLVSVFFLPLDCSNGQERTNILQRKLTFKWSKVTVSQTVRQNGFRPTPPKAGDDKKFHHWIMSIRISQRTRTGLKAWLRENMVVSFFFYFFSSTRVWTQASSSSAVLLEPRLQFWEFLEKGKISST